jgi:hypothetical protein
MASTEEIEEVVALCEELFDLTVGPKEFLLWYARLQTVFQALTIQDVETGGHFPRPELVKAMPLREKSRFQMAVGALGERLEDNTGLPKVGELKDVLRLLLVPLRALATKLTPSTSATRPPKIPAPLAPSSQLTVFVSHSHADAEVAGRLGDLMRSAFNFRIDEIRCTSAVAYQTKYGADAIEQIRDEVVSCPIVLGIISAASVESSFVLFELGARWGARGYFVAMLVPGISFKLLPAPIGNKHSMVCDSDDKVIKLVEEIAQQLGLAAPPLASYRNAVASLVAAASSPRSAPSVCRRPRRLHRPPRDRLLNPISKRS